MKKRKIINFLSTLFGVTALCGLFALSSFDYKQIELTNADGETIPITEGEGSLNITSDYNADYIFSLDYSYVYYKTYINSEPRFIISFTISNSLLSVSDGVNLTDYPLNFGSNLDSVTWQYTMNVFYDTFDIQFDPIDYFASYYNGSIIEVPRFSLFFQLVSGTVNLAHPGYSMYGYEYPYTIVGAGYEEVRLEDFFPSFTTIHIANTLEENNYQVGYSDGYTAGYNSGYFDGNSVGFNNAYEQGYAEGVQEASDNANLLLTQYYNNGYADGYAAADNQDEVTSTVINGILQVGFVPVNFFLSILNFDLLGINIKGLVTAIITIGLVLVIWRVIINGKSE